MATRSLGSLTVDLLLKMGGFKKGADQATREMDALTRKMKSGFRTLQGVITGLVAGVGFGKIVQATIEAEQATAKLEQVLKSTGGVSGFTSKQLQAVAGQLQRVTAFGDDAVVAMQAVLLTFTNVRGDQFTAATEAVLDLSTALNMDLQSAALLVGKALNDPVKGATALQRSGIQLSESQKELIKTFVETGEVAKAQEIIIRELGTQFGGQARAIRDTFGGALKSVQNAFGDLLEVNTGVPAATRALNELSDVLMDPQTKAGADALFSTLIRGAATATKFIADTLNTTRFLAEELAAIRFGAAAGDQVRIENDIAKVESALKNPSERLRFFGREGIVEWWSEDELNAELKRLKGLLDEYGQNVEAPFVAPVPSLSNTPYSLCGGDDGKAAAKSARDTADALRDQAKAYQDIYAAGIAAIEGLRTPVEEQIAQYQEQKYALEQLAATYPNLAAEASGALARLEETVKLEPLEITAKPITAALIFPEKEQEQLSVFFEEASRSVQGILADFIFDPFESGIEGLVDSFAKMLQRMAAEAIAADIAGKIFGTGGVSSGGGWLGKAAGVLGGLFGGGSAASASIGTINGFDFSSIGLASGGYTGDGGKYEPAGIVHAGEFVTRSEVTRQPGAIGFLEAFNRVGMQALHAMPGFAEGGLVAAMPSPIRSPTLGMRSSGMTVQNNFTINAPNGTVSRATEQQIAAAAARGASRANVRNN
jgi:hypothetical protein